MNQLRKVIRSIILELFDHLEGSTGTCEKCGKTIKSKGIKGNPIKIGKKFYHPYCAGDIKDDTAENPNID